MQGAVESCDLRMNRQPRKASLIQFIESREECDVRSLEETREESRDFVGQVGR